MKQCFFMEKSKTGLLLVDVQEKLFPLVDHPNEVFSSLVRLIEGFKKLALPIVVSEQYPQGVGKTIPELRQILPEGQKYWEKTTFACGRDAGLRDYLFSLDIDTWVIAGIEAHVCVMQTAKDLVLAGKHAVVINDAISSRSIYDFSTAISEMKDWTRVTSTESALFELIGDAGAPEFKSCLELFKNEPPKCCCS
jgi:nicotinamidase-related amidase